jgi:gamma-glutamyl-gamma-aminobutyraldehyde dehydrogenase/4-guanidinobutyraldehyde dehydrogenase/NAD-dependent aldehyde dehydrogenase
VLTAGVALPARIGRGARRLAILVAAIPVLSAISFSDVEEAVEIANDTIYGLAGALWTRDVSTAHKVARQIKAGVVWVNCFDAGDITTPFGGFKQSGFGRDKSLHAMEKYTDLKLIWLQLD